MLQFLLAVALLIVGIFTWPISGLLLVLLVCMVSLDDKPHPLAKALTGILQPLVIGAGILVLIQLMWNFAVPDFDDPAIARTEHALVAVHGFLQRLKLSFPVFILVVVALVPISAYLPRLKLLDRALLLKKWLGKGATIALFVTSFTFCCQVGLVDPNFGHERDRLEAMYRKAASAESTQVANYVQAGVTARTLARMDPRTLERTMQLIHQVRLNLSLTSAGRARILEEITRSAGAGAVPAPPALIRLPRGTSLPPAEELIPSIRASRARALYFRNLAQEARTGTNAILGTVLDMGAGETSGLLLDFVGSFQESKKDLIHSTISQILSKPVSTPLESLGKAKIDEIADRILADLAVTTGTGKTDAVFLKESTAKIADLTTTHVLACQKAKLGVERALLRRDNAIAAGNHFRAFQEVEAASSDAAILEQESALLSDPLARPKGTLLTHPAGGFHMPLPSTAGAGMGEADRSIAQILKEVKLAKTGLAAVKDARFAEEKLGERFGLALLRVLSHIR